MAESSLYRVEIRTTDLERATAFYTSVFGWKATREAPDYVSLDPGGGPLVALMQIPGPHVPIGVCPYVTVADCGEAVKTLNLFGGRVLIPPTHNPAEGAFAVGTDPHGNEIGMIQLDAGMIEPRPLGGTSPIVWMEIPYAKLAAGASFYQQMFEWTFLGNPNIPDTGFFKGDERPVGVSVVANPHAKETRGSTLYFAVESVAEARAKIQAAGGQVAPDTGTAPGEGAFTLFGDLDNLRFGLYQTTSIH